ncbi:hypothetical protein COLO4_00110 [Corchorus olitorius]|uniref:Aspartic peptidase n=1 Tax=Corchorus olitorius TaxID=93759 RepID=A0A1R3L4M9_9ROSI|nr:hypothetical protein COLO4_00110 [Corchorus olitorius]
MKEGGRRRQRWACGGDEQSASGSQGWTPSTNSLVLSRHYKVDLPKFDGENFRGWLLKLQQYFKAEIVLEEAKIGVTMLGLEGDALEWNQYLLNTKELVALKHSADYLGVEVAENEEFSDCQDTLELMQTEPEFDEQVVVSIHAIYGTTGFQTMRICCKMNNHTVIALVDSGSTHNSIKTATTKFLGLPIARGGKMEVTVANSVSLNALGKCNALQ